MFLFEKYSLFIKIMLNKLFDYFIKVSTNIFSLLNDFYNLIFKILTLLDSNIRMSIYIAITGLTIAIIIFIVGIVTNKKYEIDKKVILEETAIFKLSVIFVAILFLMLIASCINQSFGFIYFIIQLLINILICVFTIKTLKSFYIIIKLNTSRNYYDDKLEKYVFYIVKKSEIKNSKYILLQEKNTEKFEKYITKESMISRNRDFLDGYVQIYSSKKGIIENFDYSRIDSLLSQCKYKNSINSITEYSNAPVLIINVNISDSISTNSVIGFCAKKYYEILKNFSSCIIYANNSIYTNEDIRIINESLFDKALNFKDTYSFDSNGQLYSYLKFLYENGFKTKELVISKLEKTFRHAYKENNNFRTDEYIDFSNKLLILLLSRYENFEDYETISNLVYSLYSLKLKNEDSNKKQVVYDFVNNYFDIVNYYVREKFEYYDVLLANLLNFICNLIMNDQFECLAVIFENIRLYNRKIIEKKWNAIDICNFQFVIGIISFIVIYVEKKEVTPEIIDSLQKLIDWCDDNFMYMNDGCSIILNFRKYYDKKSNIQNVYDNFEFKFADEFRNHWGGFVSNGMNELRELIYTFSIYFINIDDNDLKTIQKDDKYYYKSLLEIFGNNERTKFEKIFNINYNNKKLIELLKKMCDEADNKEREYNKNCELNKQKLEKFKKVVEEKIFEKIKLEDYLKLNNKVEFSNVKLKRVFGINELIPREIFLDGYGGVEMIAEDYATSIKIGIEQEFLKALDGISSIAESDIDTAIANIKNLKDYVLICNYLNGGKLKRRNFSIIDNNELDVLEIPKTNGMYLIEKKYLPKLEYCHFDDSYSKKNIKDNMYYELSDLSKNEVLRNEIIEKNSWLDEKGSKEQKHDYLMQKCRLRIYISFKLSNVENANALKFKD